MADEYFIWTTTRRIKDGMQQEFEEAWQPQDFPDGMLRAYELIEEGTGEIVGVSIWDSKESCEAYRASDVESERREARAPYVKEERSRTYTGRELGIPGHS
jgi:heme-degrading monooxygenase HmoA